MGMLLFETGRKSFAFSETTDHGIFPYKLVVYIYFFLELKQDCHYVVMLSTALNSSQRYYILAFHVVFCSPSWRIVSHTVFLYLHCLMLQYRGPIHAYNSEYKVMKCSFLSVEMTFRSHC